jgi:hypothetical protein
MRMLERLEDREPGFPDPIIARTDQLVVADAVDALMQAHDMPQHVAATYVADALVRGLWQIVENPRDG